MEHSQGCLINIKDSVPNKSLYENIPPLNIDSGVAVPSYGATL